MKIFEALGTGIFLVILSVMMPLVFAEMAKTAIVFLQSSETALQAAASIATRVNRH